MKNDNEMIMEEEECDMEEEYEYDSGLDPRICEYCEGYDCCSCKMLYEDGMHDPSYIDPDDPYDYWDDDDDDEEEDDDE